jgi:hypothetical protein
LRRVNAGLVGFLTGFENISRTEFDAVIAALASLIDYENVRIPEFQSFRRPGG